MLLHQFSGVVHHSGVKSVAMPLCIDIKQLPNHFLIFCMMFFGFPFKKIKTGAAERERDHDIFLLKGELFRRGKEIINYADVTYGFICIFTFCKNFIDTKKG